MERIRFANLDQVSNMKTWDHFVRWQQSRRTLAKDYSFVIGHHDRIDLQFLYMNRERPTVTWIGHSTFLIQLGGLNIVTDPVWSNRMGMHLRLTPPGIPIQGMPEIDVVLISHSHYDHLHFKSIRALRGNPLFLVPAGLGVKFKNKGFSRVQEFNWWEGQLVKETYFSFVPTQHWSKRTPWDTNRSLWGGWAIDDNLFGRSVYFMGDSGYFSGFHEIGNRHEIDLALVPIGAYEPEWFMGRQHVSPEEAVQAFIDLRGKTFVPMHFNTFKLADDTPQEALLRLRAEWRRRNLCESKLKVLRLGEILTLH
ncbi:MBL fold metallo-hydrolase [Ammoniphilus oxalaticus]|uniref:MBL fold metallo-hydrolase n=1 Tax=Ammoniphilus oxalaticus TaxID=66863 RepID=A0A419SK36_9BACL|nr:MBL fold metallo-hydrolase [Ammoniphilus oxalaticus]RKD24335.1 MBL fold metallo-hydrolase [Ammoniphilus oxalaticus]